MHRDGGEKRVEQTHFFHRKKEAASHSQRPSVAYYIILNVNYNNYNQLLFFLWIMTWLWRSIPIENNFSSRYKFSRYLSQLTLIHQGLLGFEKLDLPADCISCLTDLRLARAAASTVSLNFLTFSKYSTKKKHLKIRKKMIQTNCETKNELFSFG